MDGGTKVPFVRHSVQRQRQSLLDQRRRPARRPCKNRRSRIVPDQHRQGTACRRRQGLHYGPVGVRKARHAPGGRGDGPSGRPDRDSPAAVPDGLDTRVKRQRLARPANELASLAGHENLCPARLDACSAEAGGEVLSGAQPVENGGEPVSTRQPVAAADTDEDGGEGVNVGRSFNIK